MFVGVTIGSMFQISEELKIYYMLHAVHKLYLLLPVLNRHIGHLVGARLVIFSSSCSLSYSGKVTKASQSTPSGYEIAAKTVAWATFTPH